MAMFSRFEVMGRVTKAPEIKMSAKGNKVAIFTIASDIGYKDNEKTNYVYCMAGNTKFHSIADQIEAMKITPNGVIKVAGDFELKKSIKIENVPQEDGSLKTMYLQPAPLFIVDTISYVSIGGKKQDGQQAPAQNNGYAPQNAPVGAPAPQMAPPMPAPMQQNPVAVPGVGNVAPAAMPGYNAYAPAAAPVQASDTAGYTVIEEDEDLPF